MRKLREAAVLAAVVGSVTMLGAGVASAGGSQPPIIACNQTNGDTVESGDVDAPALTALTPGSGNADARAQQNNCGIDIENNTNTAGDATGGEAVGLLGA